MSPKTHSRRRVRLWRLLRGVILFGLCFVIAFPLLYMLSCAFRDPADMNDPTVLWIPRHLSLQPIRDVLRVTNAGTTLWHTIRMNLLSAVFQVISCAVTGYGFARFRFPGRKLLFFIVILMILVPNQIILLPQYMQFQEFDVLGLLRLTTGSTIKLINTPWVMYLPAISANGIRAGLMILLFRQSFRGLPQELEDAACLDGCGPVRTFVYIMVPNASSAFLTVFLFSVVWYWNDSYVSGMFFTNQETVALAVKGLRTTLNMQLFGNASVNAGARETIVWLEAGCLLSLAPMLLFYIFLQKYFTESIERSGLVA